MTTLMTGPYYEDANYCVARMGRDLKQDEGHKVGVIQHCEALCDADPDCSAFEWYEDEWKGKRCFLITTWIPAVRGAEGPQWRDAQCYVKGEGTTPMAMTTMPTMAPAEPVQLRSRLRRSRRQQ